MRREWLIALINARPTGRLADHWPAASLTHGTAGTAPELLWTELNTMNIHTGTLLNTWSKCCIRAHKNICCCCWWPVIGRQSRLLYDMIDERLCSFCSEWLAIFRRSRKRRGANGSQCRGDMFDLHENRHAAAMSSLLVSSTSGLSNAN